MSFFSKVEGMFKDDKKEGQPGQPDGQRGFEQQQYGYQQPQQQGYAPPQSQYNTYPQQYNTPPPAQQYGAPPPQQYGAPPPQQYGAPAGPPPPPPPQLPQGWMPLWDPAGQRWAYLELSVSKVIWTLPTGPSYPPQGGYPPQQGGAFPPQGAPAYGAGQDTRGYGGGPGGLDQGKPAKDNSKKNMMLGAAAGVAVGAVGAGLIANAMAPVFHFTAHSTQPNPRFHPTPPPTPQNPDFLLPIRPYHCLHRLLISLLPHPTATARDQLAGNAAQPPTPPRSPFPTRGRPRKHSAFGPAATVAGVIAGSIVGWLSVRRLNNNDEVEMPLISRLRSGSDPDDGDGLYISGDRKPNRTRKGAEELGIASEEVKPGEG
ncbi:uncharacterized protein BP5553_06494 [Venustampulla echinocandica]|uniref:WW domain-containing protein n=1 Tax=Venustampulla echinocandica TaxID=2656787 RepID=A0A370TK33_9HELO|nr:uncharacterized protein BP5553_06494 [Venustampulla echinocandica]RDL35882.1 hypothetical protein BP5553_06494 [Venustampulla echinocandica]